jgi:hypothetical protein
MKKLFTILALLTVLNVNAQWVNTNVPGGNGIVQCFAVSGTNIYAGLWGGGGIYLSTNSGTNWTAVNNGLTNTSISALAVTGSRIFAGSDNGGIFMSNDNGASWGPANNGLGNYYVHALIISGTYVFAGTDNGVFLSTDNGTLWTSVGLNGQWINAFAVSGTTLYVGSSSGLFSSTNNGTNWNYIGFSDLYNTSLGVLGTSIYIGTSGGVYLSSNNGVSWSHAGLADPYIMSIAFSGTTLIVGTYYNNGIFMTTNNGLNWIQKNQGFNTASQVWSLCIANNYLFAGTSNQSVWRRVLSEILEIKNVSAEKPSSFSLSQNYPNPFNPTTKIKFDIAKSGDVNIIVYDVKGREVQTLVKERLQPGTYETSFDGSKLNSGVYFYKLITNGYTETKKMLLVK